MQLYDWQKHDVETLKAAGFVGLLAMEPGSGKGSPLDERVLTPTGWTTMGELEVGDLVVGSDGLGTEVVDIYDRGVLPVYRVTFRDGSSVRVDGDHLWQLTSGAHAPVVETREIAAWPQKRRVKYHIPATPEVQHPEADLPIDPYLLGALIADGYLAHEKQTVQWTKNELAVVEEVRQACDRQGVRLSGGARYDTANQYNVTGVRHALRDLGLNVLSGEKFVPEQYLTASVEQRWALVNGLFDGDGRVRKERGTARYSTVSEQLANNVLHLLWSLGVSATKSWSNHPRSGWWEVTIHSTHNPFRASKHRDEVTGGKRTLRRSIVSVELEGHEPVRCIRVAADDHLYITEDYIVTHNTILSVATTIESGAKQVFVIAPQSTHMSAWNKTLVQDFGLPEIRVVGNKNKAQKRALEDLEWGMPGWYITTPQFFTRNGFENITPDMSIIDECHQLTRANAKGQRALSGYRVTDRNPLSVRSTYRLALSGTPARNRFENMWGVMRFLWPELDGYAEVAQKPFSDWQSYRMESKFSPFTRSGKEYVGEKWPGLLMQSAPCVIRHYARHQCCEWHPEGFLPGDAPLEIVREYELTPAQTRHVTGLEESAVAWLGENPLVAEIPLTAQLRIRQALLGELSIDEDEDRVWLEPGAKSPLADRIEETIEEFGDEPIVVFTSSKIFARYLTDRLGEKAREVSGDTKKTRDRDIAEFGDKYQVLVGVIDAIGTGTDGLQKKSAVEIWADRSLDRTNNHQGEGRLWRTGQTRRVTRVRMIDNTGRTEKRYNQQALADEKLARSVK